LLPWSALSLRRVDRAQRRPVQQPIQGCLGDCLQVLTLTARKIQVEPGQGARRLDEARLAFEKMLTYANHVGLYAEQIGRAGQQQGNFPQALTHLALISAAFNLDRGLGA
jgi:hypothetical protein